MSHLRLTTSDASIDTSADAPVDAPSADDQPGPGAARFAAFTPMVDQPGLADRKASFVIGAGGLLLSTTLYFVMPLGQFVRPGLWPAVVLALALATAGVTLLGIGVAYRCCMLAAPVPPGNLLFFQNIAGGPAAAYAAALGGTTTRRALRDVLAYNHTMARLGAAKYRLAGRALFCLRVAIPLWMLLLVVVAARGG